MTANQTWDKNDVCVEQREKNSGLQHATNQPTSELMVKSSVIC